MPFPNLLAGGVTNEGTFTPFELFAGEYDVTSTSGIAGAAAIPQFAPVARNEDGTIVAWNQFGGAATIAGTFSGVGTANDTIVINGVTLTLVAAAANAHQVTIGATPTATAAAVAAAINALPDEFAVTATSLAAVLTLHAIAPGVGGNSITLAETGTGFSWAGAATVLAGGTAEASSRAIGVAAQPFLAGKSGPYYTGGVFNHEALVWPAGVTTLAQRQAVFDGTPIGIRDLKGVSTPMTFPT